MKTVCSNEPITKQVINTHTHKDVYFQVLNQILILILQKITCVYRKLQPQTDQGHSLMSQN